MSKKSYIIVIFILVILLISSFIHIYLMCFNNRLKEMPYTKLEKALGYEYFDITREEAIEIANSVVDVDYTLKYTSELQDGLQGKANLLTNTVEIGVFIIENMYFLRLLVHELVHLKYYTVDEIFTEFTTFKLLYESKNEVAHNTGIAMANEMCLNKRYNDCSYYITQYLIEHHKFM